MPVDLPDEFDMSSNRRSGRPEKYGLMRQPLGEKVFYSQKELDITLDEFRSYCHHVARLRRRATGDPDTLMGSQFINIRAKTVNVSYTVDGERLLGVAVQFYVRRDDEASS